MTGETVRVIDSAQGCPDLPIVKGEGRARAVVWPGTGALYRTFQVIELRSGSSTVSLTHPSDAAYYVVEGAGQILDVASGERHPMAEGAMVHVDAGDHYQFIAGEGSFTLLGGPCPADSSLYAGLMTG